MSTAGVPLVSAATSDTQEGVAVLDTPEVRRLLDEAGNPAVLREESETVVIELTEGSVLYSTSIPTTVGKLVFARFSDGEVIEALLLLSEEPTNPYRELINKRNRQSTPGPTQTWPVGTGGFLTVEDDTVRFVRDAHQRELVELAHLLDVNPKKIDALVDTKAEEYRVVTEEVSPEPTSTVDRPIFIVDLESESIRTTDAPSPDDIYIQDHNRNYCLYQFGACLWSLALPPSCSYCGTLCKASKIGGWAGYAACFVCISHICGIHFLWNASGCYSAAKCIEHWNII